MGCQQTILSIRISPPAPEFTTLMHLVPEIPPLAQAPVFHQLQLQLQPLHLVPELTRMATTLPQLQPQLQRQARLAKTTPALTGQNGLTRTDQSTTVAGINRTWQTAMLTEMSSKTVDTMRTRRVVLAAAALLAMMTALALVPVLERSVMRSCFLQSRLPPPSFMRPWHITTAREKTLFCSNRQTITRQARLKLGDLTKHGPSIIRK